MMRRIWATRLVCPLCGVEHYIETESAPEIKPPEKVGLAALCGSCEAMRRCWLVGEGKPRPFWTPELEARVWVELRHRPAHYQMQTWESEPHDRMLRDDRGDEILRLIAIPSRKRGYPPRFAFRWTLEDLQARGIPWPLPANPEPF